MLETQKVDKAKLEQYKKYLADIDYIIFSSFFAVSEFKFSKAIPTLQIRKAPHEPSAQVLLNKAFLAKHCGDNRTAFFLLMTHELFHHAKAHLPMDVE